ncbi:hypothetical protein FA15DRAFT_390427 [Coprinopsis marcescibilis]|uniref:F-box domain-containing protein n=1 Tax=Coprinopsis marcescibilis TaxID=230819 RepID=A0A5C3KWV5_COPMA|nr:hypothetical protein FA15DRAFT_390427 [Coprinopsis marcescibilis]
MAESNIKNLRLVNHQLAILFQPDVFRKLVIRISELDMETAVSQLTDLELLAATDSHPARTLTRELVVKQIELSDEALKKRLLACLGPAISALSRIVMFCAEWDWGHIPDSIRPIVFKSLRHQLQSLTEILVRDPYSDAGWGPLLFEDPSQFRGLNSLSVAGIKEVAVWENIVRVAASIAPLVSLMIVELQLSMAETQRFDIWEALMNSGIWLQDISTDHLRSSLVKYLSSYSGVLKRLSIVHFQSYWDPKVLETSHLLSEMASRFFVEVLPLHAATVKHLTLQVNHSTWGTWWFGKETAGPIRDLKFPQLEHFIIGTFVEDLEVISPERQDYLRLLVDTVLRPQYFPSIKVLETLHVMEYEPLMGTPTYDQQDREDAVANSKIRSYRFASDEITLQKLCFYGNRVMAQKWQPRVGEDGLIWFDGPIQEGYHIWYTMHLK